MRGQAWRWRRLNAGSPSVVRGTFHKQGQDEFKNSFRAIEIVAHYNTDIRRNWNGASKIMIKYSMPLAGLIVTVLIIILGIVDLCFVLVGGTGSSVSSFLINVGFKSPVFVFAVGFVCGHLFGMMTPAVKSGSVTDNDTKRPG